ncbi:hypothetical protein GGI11_003744 [Coemansia sp. RSA 2049]|nr:hypothetical protein H4217_008140 [Coemansia sp. RSA 1939]KAJ2515504.1 hypothetical protein GGI11_003744 [Coemansia sp. RSA 2049]KAJ2594753.1 hypothetical protein EV177_008295 [Coemansia sp. RSA 1804]KAJ2643958.1 hypothetical protein GGH99_008469 [Coemansia sp. RSA 1285]
MRLTAYGKLTGKTCPKVVSSIKHKTPVYNCSANTLQSCMFEFESLALGRETRGQVVGVGSGDLDLVVTCCRAYVRVSTIARASSTPIHVSDSVVRGKITVVLARSEDEDGSVVDKYLDSITPVLRSSQLAANTPLTPAQKAALAPALDVESDEDLINCLLNSIDLARHLAPLSRNLCSSLDKPTRL